MKKLTILTAITLTAMFSFADPHSYSVTSNTSWSSKNYSVNDGKSSTFTISAGITLTIDQSGVSCYQCTFSGGNIAINKDFTCQSCTFTNETITSSVALNLQTSTSTFTNVNFTASGTGSINATAALTINNSVFTFNNSSYLYNKRTA
jgi:hypothetical protein